MERLSVLKTYKLYIGGKFPRTESGRFFQPLGKNGNALANVCRASRKDFRNAVVAARAAHEKWAGASAFNRSQVLYRIAEMLEGRNAELVELLTNAGSSKAAAEKEVRTSVDRWVYFAGWCDKYQQVFSSVNPVSSSHFNFSIIEPTGVVSIVAPESPSLLGLSSVIAPVIASGNAVVVLASELEPLSGVVLSEVFATSDVPGGVVNMLTGHERELTEHFCTHMDVNAVWYTRDNDARRKDVREWSVDNVKRAVVEVPNTDLYHSSWETPYLIKQFTEVKTTWHPIEKIGGASSSY